MRPRHGADDVEGVFDVGDPVAHRFVQGIFQGARTRFDRNHLRTQQFHAIDVRCLTADILATHVDHAFHTITGRDGGRSHAMLSGTGLGDDPPFAHVPSQQRLPDAIIDLVCACVIQIFALEPDLGTAQLLGPPLGVIERAGTADEMLEFVGEFLLERRVLPTALKRSVQLVQRMPQGLGDEYAAVGTEVPPCIRIIVRSQNGVLRGHRKRRKPGILPASGRLKPSSRRR